MFHKLSLVVMVTLLCACRQGNPSEQTTITPDQTNAQDTVTHRTSVQHAQYFEVSYHRNYKYIFCNIVA